MTSPFLFYVKDRKIVRELIYGNRSGEKVIFGNIQEVCEYLTATDKDLWTSREIATTNEKRLGKAKGLAEQIQDA